MKILTAAAVALICVFAAGSCSRETVEVPGDERPAGGEDRALRIVFDLPGDEIGGPEEEEVLKALKADIRERSGTSVESAGFSMGSMEIVVKVTDEETLGRVKEIIADHLPAARYRIEHVRR